MDGVHLPLLLIAMLPILPNSVLCMHLPAPANLSIDSQNFVHLLSWEPGPEAPEGVSYTVDVCVPSEAGRSCEVAPCSPVPDQSPLRCNLTEVFRFPHQTYYTIVSASSGNRTSPLAYLPPFQPFKDTVPEAPMLKVFTCNETLCVHLQSPSEKLLSIYNCTVYPCFKYKLNISANGEFKFWMEVQYLQTVDLGHLVPGQEYCVSVGIKDRSSPYRPAVCESTASAESSLEAPIFAALCLILLLFLGTFVVYSWIFGAKTHLPIVLSFQGPYKEQLMGWPTVESLHIISLEPGTIKGIERDEGDGEDEEPEDESVAYERLGNQSGSCTGTSEPGSSSTPPPSATSGNGYDRTHESTREIPSSPVPVAISRSSTAPREHRLKPQLRTGIGLQQKPVKQLGHTGLSFLAHRHRDEEQQDTEVDEEEEEGGIHVNLCSLRLGGRMEEDQWEKEEIPELVMPLSLQSVQKNTTHILPTCSPSSERNVTDLEEKDEDEEDEEEEDSGYMMRN